MHLPIDRPVVIQLSSKDVIHSFGVPAMRVKRDAIPGGVAAVWGLAHFRMRGTILVEPLSAFQEFIARESAAQRGN